MSLWRRWLVLSVLLFLGVPVAPLYAEEAGLNILVPFDFLKSDLVLEFDRASGRRTKTGFLSSPEDTEFLVRQGATLWDVVVSAETELRKLGAQDRLMPLRTGPAASGRQEAEQAEGSNQPKAPQYLLSLFQDPVGLACRLPALWSDGAESLKSNQSEPIVFSSWQELGSQLVANRLVGELVLGLPLAAQIVLARALVRADAIGASTDPSGARGAPREQAEELWLQRLHWQARVPRLSLQSEILSPRVSCLVTYLSVYMNLLPFFQGSHEGAESGGVSDQVVRDAELKSNKYVTNGSGAGPDRLVFVIPGNKTVVRRFGVAIAADSAKPALARRFVAELVKRKREIADHAGLCAGADGPRTFKLCSFELLGSFPESVQIPEDLRERLERPSSALRR
jgi:hypothetical protein